MRIKMIHEITGLVDGSPWPARGGEIDVNRDEAERLIGIGAAVAVVESAKVTVTLEKATLEAPIKRTRKTPPAQA